MKFASFILSILLPAAAYAIGAAGDTEWPKTATVDLQLNLAAAIDKDGHPKVTGNLTITNPSDATLTIQQPTNRLVLAFLVFDALGNPVTPKGRGKSDPAFKTLSLGSHAAYTHHIDGLEFVTGSARFSYDLARGQLYRVIAIYRAAGPHGPGFASQETKLQIPP